MPDCRTKRGSICASHCFPSGSKGRSFDPTQKRRMMPPEPSAVSSTDRPRSHPPSLIRICDPGDILLMSVSSSVKSNSPFQRISNFSPLFDHWIWLPLLCLGGAGGAGGGGGGTVG